MRVFTLLLSVLHVSSFSKTDTQLLASTQVAQLRNGKIVMPEDTDGIIVEIGYSDRNTADDELLPQYPKSFLVSFEPMLDKYAVLLARGTRRYHGGGLDMAVPLGRHHHRGVVLPFAVSPKGGPLEMHISKIAGCSSLLEMNNNTVWGRFCLDKMETRMVDTIRMEDAMALLPDDLPIRYFKIDAQGLDGTLIGEIPKAVLHRIMVIEFESTTSYCNNLYKGQVKCEVIARYLQKEGFNGECGLKGVKKGGNCEVEPKFTNSRYRLPPPR